ncbi:DUF4424 domain-containing protein [Pseudoduganella eburnea]|uniref:DUF4424 domain-containing protein n=1 Tax=Massilia eburnea TaxID=1776165 RepID=A0A6L6QMN8_9BURK|nr:DUF4424 family protein [Massilia eburnea]MTW13599.1 DUF4424 domain-containing protein [Massilia eburnea]
MGTYNCFFFSGQRMPNTLKFALATLLLPTAALANDGVAAVGVGGIVFGKTDAIAMKKEVLTISYDKISVDYEFLNESSKDVEETIVFPLPPYSAVILPSNAYYGEPNGFSIQVDGKPVTFTSRISALTQEGKDVTAQLKKLGLNDTQIANPSVFASGDDSTPPGLSEGQIAALVELGLWSEAPEGPGWMAKVDYIWTQKFAANKLVRVHHEYRPFVAAGSGSAMYDDAAQFQKNYCVEPGFKAARAKTVGKKTYFDGLDVSYILTTGNTWKRGIEDFTLNIVKRAPDELVSLCFPGTLKKIDPLTFRSHMSNFRPAQDLRIHFGNVVDPFKNSGVMPKVSH